MGERLVIDSIAAEYQRYRSLAERAAGHLTWPLLRESLDAETNSIAVIMKHVGGNLRSRWTEPFTSDGEKPWRNRDAEFVDDFADREAMEAAWRAGWETIERVLSKVSDDDLSRTLTIRGEPHTLAQALARSLSHTSYHCGQIVMISRVLASRAGIAWTTLTVKRGGSEAFNRGMGYTTPFMPSPIDLRKPKTQE